MANEKQFQSYFMKIAKPYNFHRTSLIVSDGYPDVTAFHGDKYSLIELKDFELGKRGDKKLISLFKSSQQPWYVMFRVNGGTRLFIAWRICNADGSDKRYGLWKLSSTEALFLDTIYYRHLKGRENYREFKTVKELIEAVEGM